MSLPRTQYQAVTHTGPVFKLICRLVILPARERLQVASKHMVLLA